MEFEPFAVTVDPPLDTAHGSIDRREGFLVHVEYRGELATGEATPLPGWTESLTECRKALETAASVVDEADLDTAIAQVDVPAARHGLSLARAVATAAAQGRPLYRSLRYEFGDSRSEANDEVTAIPVNATIGGADSPPATARAAREAVDDGFACLKCKVGVQDLGTDIKRIQAVRDAIGDDIDIRVDANGAWDRPTARDAIEAFAALDVSYLEQPLPADQLEATATLREQGVDIALDESLASTDVQTVLSADAADVLVLKPMVLGGPDRAVGAAAACRNAGVEPVVSGTIDAAVARTAGAHVAASIPNVSACGLATAARIVDDIASDAAPVAGGQMSIPQIPGLGLEVRA